MKHLKKFEHTDEIEYVLGDIVVCVDNEDCELILKKDRKYKVNRIYDMVFMIEYQKTKMKKSQLYNYFIEVVDTLTDELIDGFNGYRFSLEIKNDSKKYNL